MRGNYLTEILSYFSRSQLEASRIKRYRDSGRWVEGAKTVEKGEF